MTTRTGRKKLNFLNRVDEVMHPIYYGHPGVDGDDPYPADSGDVSYAIEELTILMDEATQQEGWDDMVGIVKDKLSSLKI